MSDHGRPLRLDPQAESAGDEPAFVNRPLGAPVYHGFPMLDDVEVEGFRFGMITDFEMAPDTDGDAFVVAPDGSRAGLVWTVTKERYLTQIVPMSVDRWGIWEVGFPYPMRTSADARRNLAAIVPDL